jgi:5-methylcytosine-specific restriction endonuclease McrA
MKLEQLELEIGEQFTPAELEERFDRKMVGRGIEIYYDEEDQRYLRLFSNENGPYSDDVRSGQFTYIGDGQSGDQSLTHGNKALVESQEAPLPIYFFYKGAGSDEWEYQGLVEVVDHDYGHLHEEGRKVYQFTLQRQDEGIEKVDEEEAAADLTKPDRVLTTRSRIVRNTVDVKTLKKSYNYTCQVCGDQRHGSGESQYAEGHHLKPLGNPHDGPDVPENILILCPNHHADFDYGNIRVDPDTLAVSHRYENDVNERLHLVEDHSVSSELLKYHNNEIADF